MADTINWPSMTSYSDGQLVDAATLNGPIQQLAARTEYLKELVERNDRTKVVVDATFSDPDGDGLPGKGAVVYRAADGTYAKAIGDVGVGEWFYATQRAMAVGVVAQVNSGGGTGTVVLGGFVGFGAGVAVIADTNPASGRYYLSNTAAGRLTANPSGPVIYVADCQVNADGKVISMLVNPQYRDTGESHIHRSFVLSGMPQGGYATKGTDQFYLRGIHPDNCVPGSTQPDWLTLLIVGQWASSAVVTYTFTLALKSGSQNKETANLTWDDYQITWTSDNRDGESTSESDDNPSRRPLSIADFGGNNNTTSATASQPVGSYGMRVHVQRFPAQLATAAALREKVGNTWTVTMPAAGQAWIGVSGGFRLNLGMYPQVARYVPPVPSNGAALIVGGLELRGPVFPEDDRQWYIQAAEPAGGPWLRWVGNKVVADGITPTAPFEWTADNVKATARHIVFHANRMRVGPTDVVTSLQPAPGSPLRITSAQTSADAVQGALQIGLDVNFTSTAGGAAGHEVVKRIDGTTFVTGPVVERITAGPGLSVNQEQGSVRISVSNAVYSGDFETIALKNAKQDLAGGVFPYTKLLGWATSGTNIASGFTAKFRVPDHIPYNAKRGYHVVVSASVFGEASTTGTTTSSAAFTLCSYVLGDQACSPESVFDASSYGGQISQPVAGKSSTVLVPFAGPYTAFDPVLVHGFKATASDTGTGTLVLPDSAQRKRCADLWLKTSTNTPVVVYPGYFVGLAIQRSAATGTAYTGPIGFLSLRWNLVEVQ